MFKRITIDTSSFPLSQVSIGENSILVQEARILSCVYLVADEIVEVSCHVDKEPQQLYLPFIEQDIWRPVSTAATKLTKNRHVKSPDNEDKPQQEWLKKTKFNESLTTFIDPELKYESYTPRNGHGVRSVKAIAQNSDIVITEDQNLKYDFLKKNKKSAMMALLALAAVGIEVGLPRICLDMRRREEFLKVKETLAEERSEYLIAIAKYADESYDRLASSPDLDTILWAQEQATRKILPKIFTLELAMKKLNKSILNRLKTSFIEKGIPAIGSTLCNLDTPYQKSIVLHKFLEIFSKELATKRIEKSYPEANYQYQLSTKLGL